MMIIANVDREVSLTMAASSFSKPVIGHVAKALNTIPVARPEDSKVRATGKIKFINSTELKGIGTKFLEESAKVKNGAASIMIINKTFIIDKIIDDETLTIKENKEDSEPLMNSENGFSWIPKADNASLFKSAYKRLEDDGCICIFPEGTSHDRTEFIKLKAGIALMALGAMSEGKCKNVKILPVGLNYFKREQFRSEVIVEFGKAFEVPTEWAEEYKTNKRTATEKLLKEIEARMKAVTLTAPSYEELRGIFFVRKLYVPPNANLTPTQYTELCKRFVKGYETVKDYEDTKQMFTRIKSYINELETTGLNDTEVKNIEFTYKWMVRKTFWSYVFLNVFTVLSLPAIFIMAPFAIFIKNKAEKERLAVF
jgi:glycerol-3-phosphate O-acyltransferase/dihydroxyacetone phosphate acyltransferase